jgi:signal transduction histidine kinase
MDVGRDVSKHWYHLTLQAALCLLVAQILCTSLAASREDRSRLVVVLYPETYDGSPGHALADRGIRSGFASGSRQRVEIHNEYLDVSRFPDADYQRDMTALLRRKYADRKVDLVIAGLSSAFDFAIKNREAIFPDTPLMFLAVDETEVSARELPPDVIGAPIKMDLEASLDMALRLHPQTERVFVIAGKSKFDAYWETEARKLFRSREDKAKFVYLSGLPMAELLESVENLPEHSIAYYLHVFEDGDGFVHIPADVLERIASAAKVPFYSHVDSYVGRGIVGGRVFSFETAGRRAAEIGVRILEGESPRQIGVQPTIENAFLFDGRQLKRWGISESQLPSDSVVQYTDPSLWDQYKWQIIALVSLCVLQTLLIAGMIVQRLRRVRAERRFQQAAVQLQESQAELQDLTGKLFVAQELERGRIARELHDDFGQELALLSVEIDLLRQIPAGDKDQFTRRVEEMSARVKQLSSSIHDLSHQLHPMKLEQLGLVAAVRGLCTELSQGHSVDIEFSHQQVPHADRRDIDLCLYRIAQEALRNVVKHSGAKNCEVELRGGADAISLRIQDNGAGFDPESINDQGGLGLVSMRERLRAVQGEITIDTKPYRGTEIEIRIPLNSGSAMARELRADTAAVK